MKRILIRLMVAFLKIYRTVENIKLLRPVLKLAGLNLHL